MSEYQYYEFVAIDRPPTAAAQAELRALSSRAEITATRFLNVDHCGDFRGDPAAVLALAEREGAVPAFDAKLHALQERHPGKPAFYRRLRQHGLGSDS